MQSNKPTSIQLIERLYALADEHNNPELYDNYRVICSSGGEPYDFVLPCSAATFDAMADALEDTTVTLYADHPAVTTTWFGVKVWAYDRDAIPRERSAA